MKKVKHATVVLGDGVEYFERALPKDFALFILGSLEHYFPDGAVYHGLLSQAAFDLVKSRRSGQRYYIHQYNLKRATKYYTPVNPDRFIRDCPDFKMNIGYIPFTLNVNGGWIHHLHQLMICNPKEVLKYMGAYELDVDAYLEKVSASLKEDPSGLTAMVDESVVEASVVREIPAKRLAPLVRRT